MNRTWSGFRASTAARHKVTEAHIYTGAFGGIFTDACGSGSISIFAAAEYTELPRIKVTAGQEMKIVQSHKKQNKKGLKQYLSFHVVAVLHFRAREWTLKVLLKCIDFIKETEMDKPSEIDLQQ